MLTKILSDPQDELVREERQVLARLRAAVVRFDAALDQQLALERSIEQLDELFLLVIVGEFNAGKSAFINAIVGSRVALEGVTPTTAQINVLQYGDTVQHEVRGPALRVITAPVPLLREIGSARTSIYSNLVPVVAMLAAVTLLGESLGFRKLLGAAAVLAGVALTRVRPEKITAPAE